MAVGWVAVAELNLSYYVGETTFLIIYTYIHTSYTHYGNLI